MLLRILILALFFGSDAVIATDVVAARFEVNSANAQHYNVSLKVFRDSPLCGQAEDVYVSFSNEFRESKFKSANVSIRNGDSLLFDVAAVVHRSQDHQNGAQPPHGLTMCVNDSLLTHVRISLSYGRGEFVTNVLEISGLEEFDSRE